MTAKRPKKKGMRPIEKVLSGDHYNSWRTSYARHISKRLPSMELSHKWFLGNPVRIKPPYSVWSGRNPKWEAHVSDGDGLRFKVPHEADAESALRAWDAYTRKFTVLTREGELEVIKLAKEGHAWAQVQAIDSVLPLIRRDLRKKTKVMPWLDKDDMEQAGIVTIFRAIEMFDPSMGKRFSTYASHWWMMGINLCMRRQLQRGLAAPPRHKIRKVVKIAEDCNYDVGEVSRRAGISREFAYGLLSLSTPLTSVEAMQPCGEPLEALIPDAAPDSPEDLAARSESISIAFSKIGERERQVIQLRYLGRRQLAQVELARLWKVSRQRVDQIEKRALRKMRTALEKAEREPTGEP